MNQKRLPLAESPIGGYMYYAYHLAITFAAADVRPWFFSRFVQLQCSPARLEEHDPMRAELFFSEGTWHYNPMLRDSPQIRPADVPRESADLIGFVVDAIARGDYVETFVDEFHIPVLRMGGRQHFCHRLLLFGYDREAGCFDIVGFDREGNYRPLQCRFEDFVEALLAARPQPWETTKLLRVRDVAAHNRFDPAHLCVQLRDYLAACNTALVPDLQREGRDWSDAVYGTGIYAFLLGYVERLLREDRRACDLRGFHILWEHKRVMLLRLQWLCDTQPHFDPGLIADWLPVVKLAESLRQRALIARYRPQIGAAQLPHLPGLLRELEAMERPVLERLLTASCHTPS